MILPLARIGGVATVTEGLHNSFIVIEANENASLGLVFIGIICLRHGVTISTRFACRD